MTVLLFFRIGLPLGGEMMPSTFLLDNTEKPSEAITAF
jgi:hypothetical protein